MASSVDHRAQQHDDDDGSNSSNMRQKPPLLQSTDLEWNTFNQVNFFKSAAAVPLSPVAEALGAAAVSADNHHHRPRSALRQQQEETCILETTGGKPSKPSAIFHPTYNQDKDVDINIDLFEVHNERRSKESPSRKYPSLLTVPRDEDMSAISNITSSTCLTTNSSSRLDLDKIMDNDPWSPDFLTRRHINAPSQGQPKDKIRAVEETIIFFDDTTTEDTDSDIDDDIDDYGHYCSSGDGFNGLVASHLGMRLSCGKENDNDNKNKNIRISSKSTTAKKSTLFNLPTMEESMDAFFFSLYDILNIDDAVVSACRDDMFVYEEPVMKPATAEACQDDEDCFSVKEIRTTTPHPAVPHNKEKISDESTTELKYTHINHHAKKQDNLHVKIHSVKRDGVLASNSKDEEIRCDSQLADHTCRAERQEEGTVKRTIWNRVQSTFSSRIGIRNATRAETLRLSHSEKNEKGGINIIDESFKTEIVQVDPYRDKPPRQQRKMERIGSSLFAGITNIRQPTQKKQKVKHQQKKFWSPLRSDKQRNARRTNKKNEQTKKGSTATSNTNNPSRMSKIILSTAGNDNASTTVITIDNTCNTHEIDSESYVTPGGSTSSSEFYHHHHHQDQHLCYPQQYAV